MAAEIEIAPVEAGQALVLRVTGTLDTGAAAAVPTRLLGATDPLPPPHLVVIDLREVDLLAAVLLDPRSTCTPE
ncbi:hypothetical protein SAMN04489727_4374 [Amycolatopsis tolypomycina]|uniref:STAS domain-containing protein n=1 Tax=Amycolatopsis tolypomycina TaxID=208445 RepID=A0A1H4TVT2_9PSEU|nr:hypothetical protein [Amycolatopsis tolypomycina]SEC60585.1 hypothetical protein SAMN04489727_4374 [Amycolatopsis tolypomycina]